MNKKYLPLIFLFSILLGAPVLADPLVIVPTGDASCSVEVTTKGSPPSPTAVTPGASKDRAPTMKHVEITRMGNLRRDAVTWSDSNVTETWTFSDLGLSLIEVAYPGRCIYDARVGSIISACYMRRILNLDPASVDWITNASLVGKEAHKGRPTLHYRASVLVSSGTPGAAPFPAVYEGWIDAKTLAPMAFDDGTYAYELTFNAPPTAPLKLPDRFEKDFLRYQSAHTIARRL